MGAFVSSSEILIAHQQICCLGTLAYAETAKLPFNILLHLCSLHLAISLLEKTYAQECSLKHYL